MNLFARHLTDGVAAFRLIGNAVLPEGWTAIPDREVEADSVAIFAAARASMSAPRLGVAPPAEEAPVPGRRIISVSEPASHSKKVATTACQGAH